MRKHYQVILACFVSALIIGNAAAADPKDEDLITAKILIQLPRYITHASQIEPVLCVAAPNELYKIIQSLNKSRRTYNSIKLYRSDPNECQFVYAAGVKPARKLIAATSDSSIITISDYSNFIDEGGVIGVRNSNGTMVIELNLSAANDKHVTLSPDLIELSQRVIQ